MSGSLQDAQIFKERCEDSPGVLLFFQGDWWHPTPERVAMLERENYLVLTAANGRVDIPHWLPHPRCIGSLFGHHDTVAWGRSHFPDKVVERFEGVGFRFLRNIAQESPTFMHLAGHDYAALMPRALKTVDVVASFSAVPLKRGGLLLQALIDAGVSAYIFSSGLGANPAQFAEFLAMVQASGKSLDYIHLPFDPYALIRIDGRIVIDGRPIGANSSVVANYVAKARVCVHTSTTEGFSNSVMEALHNDVPVVLCEDVMGPLQALSQEVVGGIHRVAPDAAAIAAKVRALIQEPPPEGAVKAAFNQVIHPFEINRRVVLSVQRWFARQGLPWKGHCLGLLSGVQSRLDLRDDAPERSYRGRQPIYGDPEGARNIVGLHANIALQQGRQDLLSALVSEMKHLA